MRSDIAIDVRDVSKFYHIYNKPHDRLKQSIWGGSKKYYQEFNALNHVSFSVRRGETVGIIGQNGSGKSTLLQMICGTLSPTSGTIITDGKIAALLELGSGFNPEFTGEENVYMSGTIMGLTQQQINGFFDAIVEFADIGLFLYQPVKTYSSGMFVRLAFAVNICLQPDILIVDEALAVGDEAFQRKCFARIHQFQEQGGTILFVSHSMGAIVELCSRAILIDQGELLLDSDSPKIVASSYHKLSFAPKDKRSAVRDKIKNCIYLNEVPSTQPSPLKVEDTDTNKLSQTLFDPAIKPESTVEYESHGAWITNPRIVNKDGVQVNVLHRGQEYTYTYQVKFDVSAFKVKFGMMFKTVSGIDLGGAGTSNVKKSIAKIEENAEVEINLRFTCMLLPGTYFVNAGTSAEVNHERVFLHRIIDAVMFKVAPEEDLVEGGFVDFGISGEVVFLK
jgi:lipopolysaccharide transport system ATP-binding protein